MIEADIYRVLAALVGGRAFPDTVAADTQPPYATYTQIGGRKTSTLENAPTGLRHGRWQIDVWARTRAEAATLSRAIEVALQTDPMTFAEPIGEAASRYDDVVQLYGASQDFNISWND